MTSKIEELVRDLTSNVEDVRKAAVVWLAQLRDPATLPHLAKLADDPSPAVRYFARRAVEELKVRPALEKLPLSAADILASLKAPEREKRIAAAMACYALHDRELLPHLLKSLDGETDLHVIATLVKAVGAQRDPQVIPRLVHLLHHTDARVRSNTVDAAMLLDDADVLDAVSLLAADVSNRVRSSVALFLAHRDPGRAPAMVREMIETDLLWMKDSAVYVMHAVGAPWCLPLLEEMQVKQAGVEPLARKIGVVLSHLKARLAGSQADTAALSGTVVDGAVLAAVRAAAEAEEAQAAPAPPPAPELSDAERQAYSRLGTQAFKSSRIGELPEPELAAQAEKVAALGATLDRGKRLAQTLAQRDFEIITLGKMVLAAAREKPLENEALERETVRVIGQLSGKPVEEPPAAEAPPGAPAGAPSPELVAGSGQYRRTLKEPVLTADARGRPTMRQPVLANTKRSQAMTAPVEPGFKPWLRRNKLLVAPVVLVVVVMGAVTLGVSERANAIAQKLVPKALRGPSHYQAPVTIEEVLASRTPATFKGRRVRWSGVVRERSSVSPRIVVEAGQSEFAAEFENALGDAVAEDSHAEVEGVIDSVAGKLVNLKGKSVLATALSTFERRERLKKKKKPIR